jgi:hypothetical protein
MMWPHMAAPMTPVPIHLQTISNFEEVPFLFKLLARESASNMHKKSSVLTGGCLDLAFSCCPDQDLCLKVAPTNALRYSTCLVASLASVRIDQAGCEQFRKADPEQANIWSLTISYASLET